VLGSAQVLSISSQKRSSSQSTVVTAIEHAREQRLRKKRRSANNTEHARKKEAEPAQADSTVPGSRSIRMPRRTRKPVSERWMIRTSINEKGKEKDHKQWNQKREQATAMTRKESTRAKSSSTRSAEQADEPNPTWIEVGCRPEHQTERPSTDETARAILTSITIDIRRLNAF